MRLPCNEDRGQWLSGKTYWPPICRFHEDWDADQIQARLPIYNLALAPAPRDDDAFGQPNGTRLKGGIFWLKAGYVTDPTLSAQNSAAAARHGARHRCAEVIEILQKSGSVNGVRLADG